MRSATTIAVTSTLKKLKRKSRPGNNSGKSAYWFVIKSSEGVLKQLGEEWDQVQLQIGWRIEDCYKLTTPTPSKSTLLRACKQIVMSVLIMHLHLQSCSHSKHPRLSPAKKSPMQNDFFHCPCEETLYWDRSLLLHYSVIKISFE